MPKVQRESFRRLAMIFNKNEEELKHMPSIRPIATDLISGFGHRMHPILKVRNSIQDLIFRAPIGTPVYATADGVVKHAGHGSNGYGKHLDLDHGIWLRIKICAPGPQMLVQEGEKVERGQLIGRSGNTGAFKRTPSPLRNQKRREENRSC